MTPRSAGQATIVSSWRSRALKIDGARIHAVAAGFAPQLVTLAKQPPVGAGWLVETKWDGFRLLADLDRGRVQLRSRNNLDWTLRLPHVARAIASLPVKNARLDGELVCLRRRAVSDFDALEAALEKHDDSTLTYVLFDLVALEGIDLSRAPLIQRKQLLEELLAYGGPRLLYSRHAIGCAPEAFASAVRLKLEGIVCKRIDSPYAFERNRDWIKVKRVLADEFIVVGYTPPRGARTGFGSLLLAAVEHGSLRYIGRVGSGFDREHLRMLTGRLARLRLGTPAVAVPQHVNFEPDSVTWVAPVMVVEVAYHGIAKLGLLRQASFLRLRIDKSVADLGYTARGRRRSVNARAASAPTSSVDGVAVTHAARIVYPERKITKGDVAAYYVAVAHLMLPEIVNRPLSLVRCPNGIGGERFFQRHHSPRLGRHVRATPIIEKNGRATAYICIDDERGLLELVQMNTIEFHAWGATASAPDKPDRLIFDLDPAAGIAWPEVVAAARGIRARLKAIGIESFVRLTGGKGLHVVAPIAAGPSWDEVKEFCEGFADQLVRAQPDVYIATASKARRSNLIFVDWLRNVRGATSIAGWSLRARTGAPVSMPLRWEELGATHSASAYGLASARRRATSLARDPWTGILNLHQRLPTAVSPA